MKEKKKKKVKVARSKDKELITKSSAIIQNTKQCKVEVLNNLLPWEREVLSEHSVFKFEIKAGKHFSIKYDEKNQALSITCDNAPCNIQPMSPTSFLIK